MERRGFQWTNNKKIIHDDSKLEYLKEFVGFELAPLIECLRSLSSVYDLCRRRVLDPNFQEIISEFTITWAECSEKFGLSKTLKVHIISDHLSDYFHKEGKTLLKRNDENVEAVHSKYRQFLERHSYNVVDVLSPMHHKKQHKALVHWNSVNV